ncbi:LsmAD domain protein [Trichinella nativa]|uniref:LsmAD domain protein n=1 Tax=Trichinella nativa TaxID=6335 RepID=A0A1Y3E794_9BILA|nr:LsmAD domain protein [Trichinella nativa]
MPAETKVSFQKDLLPNGNASRRPKVAMGIYDNNRFMHAVMSIVGCNVNVFMKNGQILQGIFTSISPELDIALELVHSVSSDAEDELPVKGEVISNMVLKAYNIVSVTTMADMNAVCISSFATDGEIAKQNGDVTEKRLEQWESETVEEDHELEVNKYEVGWSAEDMFKRNEEQFGLASDFVDDLTQYNNVDVPANKDSPEYLAKLAEAERLAMLIEKNPTSKRALELENNDEERDIVDRQATYTSSALSASNSTQPSGNARAFSSNRRRGNNNGVSVDRRGGPHRGQSATTYSAAGLNTHQQRGNYRMHRDTDTGAPQNTGYGMVFSAKGNQAGGIGLKQQSLPVTTSVAISATDRRAQTYRRQDVRGGNGDGLQSVASGNARRSANPPHGKGAYKERDRLPDLKRFGQEFHLSDNRGGMVRSSQQQQPRPESHAPASVSQPAPSPTIQQSCLQQRPQQQLVNKPGNFYRSRLVLKRSSHVVYKENTEQRIVIDRNVPKSCTSPVKTEAASTTDSGLNDNGKSADVDSSSPP